MDIIKFYLITSAMVNLRVAYYQFQIIEKFCNNDRTRCQAMDAHGTIIGIHCVGTYAYFYWHTHDFRHAYVDTYTYFVPYDFLKFSKCFRFL